MPNNHFVSRGGIKLQYAIEQFKLQIANFTCLDVGSSTGGFVDCLLQNGALKVYAVDTSYGELAWKLRNDPRVLVMERTNILHLTSLPATDSKIDLVTIDAGWTRLELILPIINNFLKPKGKIIALLKPQYETEQKNLKSGVVPEGFLEGIKSDVLKKIENLGFKVEGQIESPILGGGGNKEYLLLISMN